MADQRKSGISWTDQTWNPTRGCSRVSEGCRNCYAEKVAGRFSGEGQPYHGLAVLDGRGARWTGKLELIEKHLHDPIRWKRPRKIFVNSMSDLFHEDLDGPTIARVFAVMALAPRHTFQVLTKRAAKMREVLTDPAFENEVREVFDAVHANHEMDWPLSNVWLGVSVEHQEAANERTPDLIETPAAVRFLSCEPLLGQVDLDPLTCPDCGEHDASVTCSECGRAIGECSDHPAAPASQPWCVECDTEMGSPAWLDSIDWVIVGGESGPNARPMKVGWSTDLIDQCADSNVAVWMKQTGSVLGRELALKDRSGSDVDEWPSYLCVQQFPERARAR